MIESLLKKNENGRFELAGFELCSGDTVELKTATGWVRHRIEFLHHNWGGGQYYAVSPKGFSRTLTEGEIARDPRTRWA